MEQLIAGRLYSVGSHKGFRMVTAVGQRARAGGRSHVVYKVLPQPRNFTLYCAQGVAVGAGIGNIQEIVDVGALVRDQVRT
jgi:hypothetical protein